MCFSSDPEIEPERQRHRRYHLLLQGQQERRPRSGQPTGAGRFRPAIALRSSLSRTRRDRGERYSAYRSMNLVSKRPAAKSASRMMRWWSGIVVLIPSMTNISSERSILRMASGREFA